MIEGSAQTATPVDTTEGDGIFTRVDSEAYFDGGETAWRTFLQGNLKADVPVDRGAPIGMYTVMIQFVVDLDGSVSDIKALTKEGFGMEQEVLRLMKTAAKWHPAILNGKPVRAYRKQPVTFLVEQEGIQIKTKVPYSLYTGSDNEITIESDDVKYKDMDVSISSGTITSTGTGSFTATVTKPGRVVVTVNSIRKRKNPLCQISFKVVSK
jgi:hypothetical protein